MTESVTLEYRDPFGAGMLRPNLWLDVDGPDGQSHPIPGLVDSGADMTSMPLGFASILGYTAQDLTVDAGTSAGGAMSIYKAQKPCEASVSGIEQRRFELWPWFTDGEMVLWGRQDFMLAFTVIIDETQQQFALAWE